MSPIEIPFDELDKPATWKPGGQSPTMNPQATVQFVQMLLGMLASPELVMASGVDIHALFGELIRSGPMRNNAKKIQRSFEKQNEQLMAAGVLGPPGGMVGPAGGPPNEGLPSAPTGAGEGLALG